ncbi:suppressor of fused domain protein [uncultured Cardiobacterium sp.]|uniref:suppressor of fused domain protein n=1 Tax=uncultured Cardiobacterium sp. TaxID=417619 RepID=UPI0026044FC6|nr:suppressor of fused domain protein [uncultured Cardiobacterium sp.]
MDTAESLRHYLETLAARSLSSALNPGASEADLKNFESEHGIRLPDSLAGIYRAFNGQIHDLIPPGEPRWLALDEIYGKQQEWREFCETYYGKHWPSVRLPHIDAEGLAKNTLYNPFWLPFMADNEGFYCVDFDPDTNGNSGQIIYTKINTDPATSDIIHLDDSFALWFDSHAHALGASHHTVGLATLLDEYLTCQRANPALPLNPPANPNDIRITEHINGIHFPDNLKKIWAAYNGYKHPTADNREYWIGHDAIAAAQTAWRDRLAARFGADPATLTRPDADAGNQAQPYYYHPMWLPVYQMGDIIIALDYAPGEDGSSGQPLVIYSGEDYEILTDYESFDEWLYTFLSYTLYPEENDDPPPVSAANHSYRQEMRAHIERHFGPIAATFKREESASTIDLLWLPPDNDHPYQTLITSGLSDHPMDVPDDADRARRERIELMIMLPLKWQFSPQNLHSEQGYWPIVWLSMLADYAQSKGNWIGIGNLFPNGNPMTPIAGTPFSGVTILPPFIGHPQESGTYRSKDGTRINIYCLMPLYAGEIELLNREGLEALLARFDACHITSEVADPARPDSSR